METPEIKPQNIFEASQMRLKNINSELKEKLERRRGGASSTGEAAAAVTSPELPVAEQEVAAARPEAPVQKNREADLSYRKKFQEDKFREDGIKYFAQAIHDRRWDKNKAPWLQKFNLKLERLDILQLLDDNHLDPETPEAAEFMEKWDYAQAEKIYEQLYGEKPAGKEIGVVSVPEVAPEVKAGKEPAVSQYYRDEHGYLWPKEERDPVKAVALHTIYKAKQFEDLNAPNFEKGDEKIIELTKELWDEFATHGFVDPDPVTGEIIDPETGEIRIKGPSDLDGRSFLAILKKAGIKVDNVTYTAQGKMPKSKSGVVGDTAGEHGVVAKDGGKALIFDHHADISGRDTSATKFAFDTLKKFGLFNEKDFNLKALENYVEFVTKEDNKEYSDDEIKLIIENYDKSLIGLQRYMSEEQLISIFEEYADAGLNLNPYDAMPEDFLADLEYRMPNGKPIKGEKERPMDIVAKKLVNLRNMTLSAVQKLAREGSLIDTGEDRFGRILIDTGTVTGQSRKKNLKGEIGIEAARYSGFGGIVWWNPEKNNFSVQTADDYDFDFPDGFDSRGHYWLKIPGEEKMSTTLEEILGKLAGKKDFQVDESLRQALGKAKIRTVDKRKGLNEKQKEVLKQITEKARLGEIEEKIPKDTSGLSVSDKTRWRVRSIALGEAKRTLRNIAMNFSEDNLAYFRDGFMGQILEYYQSEKKNISGLANLTKFRNELLEYVEKAAKEGGFDEKEIDYIKNYFRSMFKVEFLVNKSN